MYLVLDFVFRGIHRDNEKVTECKWPYIIKLLIDNRFPLSYALFHVLFQLTIQLGDVALFNMCVN